MTALMTSPVTLYPPGRLPLLPFPVPSRAQPFTRTPGAPPRRHGVGPNSRARFAIACRASAVVLELEGLAHHAAYLRSLADAVDEAPEPS